MLAFALSMFLVALIPLASGWVFYVRSDAVVRRQQEQNIEKSLEITVQSVNDDIESLINMAILLKSDLRGIELPDYGSDMTTEKRLALHDITVLLRTSISAVGDHAAAVYVMRENGDYAVTHQSVIEKKRLYERYFAPGVDPDTFASVHQGVTSGRFITPENGMPMFVMTLNRPSADQEAIQIVFLLQKNYLSGIVAGSGLEDAYYVVTAPDGSVFLYAGEERDAEREVRSSRPLSLNGYTLTAAVPLTHYSGNAQMLKVLYITLLVICLAVLAALIYWLSKVHTSPIEEITDFIRTRFPERKDAAGYALIRQTVSGLAEEQDNLNELIRIYQANEKRRDLSEALLGVSGEKRFPGGPFVLAVFFLPGGIGTDSVLPIIEKYAPQAYAASTAVIADKIYLMLEPYAEDNDGKRLAADMEAFLEKMDECGLADCRMAFSAMHHGSGQLPDAFREANLALDVLIRSEGELVFFDRIRFSSEYFLRDENSVALRLSFSEAVGRSQYQEALDILPALFPDEYMRSPDSPLAGMHLDALKYQFLYDADAALRNNTQDASSLEPIIVSRIMTCRDHRALMEVMKAFLSELDDKKLPDEHGVSVDDVKRFIRENAKNPQLSVSMVADVFSVPANTLSKQFSRKSNMGILQYIHEIRIEEACDMLLADEEKTISEIASAVGYTSTLTFSRAFKKRYAMTPGEYRKIRRSDDRGSGNAGR